MKTPKILGWYCDRFELRLFFVNGDMWRREHAWKDGQWRPVAGPPYYALRPEPPAPATKRRRAKAR